FRSREKRLQGLQGDLPSIRSPHTDSDFFARRNRSLRLQHQDLRNCCIWDSVESVEQPWVKGTSKSVRKRRVSVWKVFSLWSRLWPGRCLMRPRGVVFASLGNARWKAR